MTTCSTKHAVPGAGRRSLVGVVLLASLLWSGTVFGQQAEDFVKLGNDAYNGGDFAEAVAAYTKAIQLAPKGALRAYVNRARAHNKLEQYAESVQYYGYYLELAPDADDARKVKAELSRVEKKLKGSAAVVMTESQKAALEQLGKALEAGPYLTDQGGGAAALYDVVLRTEYATPQLATLQQRLAEGLLAEALAAATPSAERPTPALGRDGWELQSERVNRALSFGEVSVDTELAAALLGTSRGWQSYLKGDLSAASRSFTGAVGWRNAQGVGLLAAHWGRALCAVLSDEDAALATQAIDAAASAFAASEHESEPYVSLLRAKALQRAGKAEAAAALVAEVR